MIFSKQCQEKLTAPFDETEIKFKPTAIKNNQALALPYVDARTILDRLDEAVGPENWHDEYQIISENKVICKLTILGITKSDAGESSSEEKEPLKSAVSDALKRAAVKFGIGRYLYKLPKFWYDFDPTKGEFIENPGLSTSDLFKETLFKKISDGEVETNTCSSCGRKISNRVAVFSKKHYEKPLCMKCQGILINEKESSNLTN